MFVYRSPAHTANPVYWEGSRPVDDNPRVSAPTRRIRRPSPESRRDRPGESCNGFRRLAYDAATGGLAQRTFSPYFCVIGGTTPFIRKYSTSCP
jgi:hypothetical protein